MPRKRRVVIYVDEPQYAALKRLQRNTGASIAELCRRCISAMIEAKKGNQK